jgi:solute carrier family 25 (mitochondrial uncoupling protein), member 8/9
MSGTRVLSKCFFSLSKGVIAIVVANPTDLVKVRLQADGKANTVKRNYSGALNAYATIIRQVASTVHGHKDSKFR